MDGTRFIYKSCGALPALVQECADRLAALALLMGKFGTGVCVCVCVLAGGWWWWSLIHEWPILTDGKVLLIENYNLTAPKLPFGKLERK